jgi:hypothetical protein
VGDFNGDGKDDIAWYESWSTNITILTTNSGGNGSSASSVWTTGYSAPDWASIGDFSGDGKDDIAWYSGWDSGRIKVLQTNSAGTGFGSSLTWAANYGNPQWAGVGDFNGDGKDDIAWYESWSTNITILLTNTSGSGVASSAAWTTGYSAPDWAGVG